MIEIDVDAFIAALAAEFFFGLFIGGRLKRAERRKYRELQQRIKAVIEKYEQESAR